MDLRLPKVDGIEILKTLRSNECLRNIPAVILTTSQAESDISRAYQYNVNSYLVKPLDSEKFSKLIESFGFYWVVWNKYPDCT
jgi:CheY-like chemotaxis protein